jgi:hypothetical protein
MSHQIHSKKPSLPSIQFLLHEPILESPQSTLNSSTSTSSSIVLPSTSNNLIQQPVTSAITQQPQLSNTVNTPPKRHHRHSSSISSLPSELQQLSLSAPAFNNIPTADERSENHQPSWMMMPPTTTTSTTLPSATAFRRPPGASHSRSVSDVSFINNNDTSLPPVPTMLNRNRHRTHRRSVSANTTLSSDFFKMIHNPTPAKISNHSLPYIDEHQCYTRAHTDSPPLPNEPSSSSFYHESLSQERLLFDALKQPSPTSLFSSQQHEDNRKIKKAAQQHNHIQSQELSPSTSPQAPAPKKKEYENMMVARDETTGRYYCPYCNKAFNRPSSLRIHTYSHTGEKPFVCPEANCGREFSVQSNMRRHIRVHRLGGRSKTNSK